LTHIHVGNAKPLDVLRPSGKVILHPLKENTIETSRVVMLASPSCDFASTHCACSAEDFLRTRRVLLAS
jgi:hypothetical protein